MNFIMKNLLDYIIESQSKFDKMFKRLVGNNEKIKSNFIKLIDNELLGDNPMFKSQKEMLEDWPTIDDAIADNSLYVTLEDSTEHNDFNNKAFYNVIDMLDGSHHDKKCKISSLVYIYLQNTLK